jgi:hypothetical protein
LLADESGDLLAVFGDGQVLRVADARQVTTALFRSAAARLDLRCDLIHRPVDRLLAPRSAVEFSDPAAQTNGIELHAVVEFAHQPAKSRIHRPTV